MKKKLQIKLVLVLAIMLQACAGAMDRVKLINALDASDIGVFKAEVTRIKTNHSLTPDDRAERLYFALMFAAKRSMEATKYVIGQGVPLDYPAGQPSHNRRGMALTSAVEANQPEIVSLLLERGANPNIELWSIGPTDNILYISTFNTDLAVSRILLEAGANPNQWSNPIYSSMIGFWGKRPDIQKLLKDYGGVENPTKEQRISRVKGQQFPTVSTPLQEKHASMGKTVEERLQTIDALKEQGVINQKEYSEARNKILSNL